MAEDLLKFLNYLFFKKNYWTLKPWWRQKPLFIYQSKGNLMLMKSHPENALKLKKYRNEKFWAKQFQVKKNFRQILTLFSEKFIEHFWQKHRLLITLKKLHLRHSFSIKNLEKKPKQLFIFSVFADQSFGFFNIQSFKNFQLFIEN